MNADVLQIGGPFNQERPHFCTFTHNIEQYEKGLPFESMPATFQDAITTTRELGQRYLWIDSICIIQGPDGDFPEEAKRMEDVFSSAYCVIAASSATNQHDGFLSQRENSEILRIGRDQHQAWISPFVDDFQAHVLDGPLGRRGWVFQERALSRRTIFFTNQQIYWECGEGVRCETLTSMTK